MVTTNTKRILLVLTQALDPNAGGVQMSTWKMARYFASKGHSVAIVSCAASGHRRPDFASLYFPSNSCGGVSQEAISCIYLALDQFQPTIVLNQMPYERSIGDALKTRKSYVLLACLRNTLFSVRSNIDQYIDRGFPTVAHPLLKNTIMRKGLLAHHRFRHRRQLIYILNTYDKFVMFGPPNLEELRYFVPEFDRSRVSLVPNSVPSVADGIPAKKKRILWLGRLNVEQKRADLIVPFWERVSSRLVEWHMDVVGDGPYFEQLRHEIETRKLERISLHGRQPGEDYYQRSAIFVMTSAFEGFPNTLVEAQSAGAVPFIFDSYPIASWVVENAVNGVLIDPFDVDVLANAVVSMSNSDDLASMQAASLVNARRFDIGTVGAMWLKLFDECLREHNSKSKVATESSSQSATRR